MKIKAFTLMELLIGMIISAIVIAFCYSAYFIVSERLTSYRTSKAEINETMTLRALLYNELESCEFATYDSSSHKISFKKYNGSSEYTFSETCILRKVNEVLDTFKIKSTDLLIEYPQERKGYASVFIGKISFKAKVLDENYDFSFYKNYSSEVLVNSFKNHIGDVEN